MITSPDTIEISDTGPRTGRLIYTAFGGYDKEYVVVVSATVSAGLNCARIVTGYVHSIN